MVETQDLRDAYHWAQEHTVTYTQMSVLLALLFSVWLLVLGRRPKPSVRKEPPMDPTARKTRVRELVRDAYVNAIYDQYRLGKVTYDEYQREMLRLRTDMGFDVTWRIRLHPKALAAECLNLKEAIKGRLPPEKVEKAIAKAKVKPPEPKKGLGKFQIALKTS